jgi:glycosyltransferase involved in cell wall biosynthesis
VVHSPAELASRIKSLLSDPKRIARMSEQSRQRARSRFSLADSAKSFAEVLTI